VNLTARRAQRIGLAAIVAVGAFSAVFAVTRLADDGPRRYDDERSVAALDLPTAVPSSIEPSAGSAVASEADPPAAATPEGVVAAFLEAERAGDFAASFALLSQDERAASSVTAWTAGHADLPEILDFELGGSSRPAGDRSEVTVRAKLRPHLDEVVGLVPGSADLTLATVEEGGEWRVLFSESRREARYLDDVTAARDARAWVERRAACSPADEYSGGLLGAGAATLAGQLCEAEGSVAVGTPRPLADSPEADPYVAAFGPEALEWARVVPVSSPARLDVVVAPVGEVWLVIGASTATA
jgi:hypothetical protein